MDEEDKKQKVCRMREEKEFLDEIAGRLARENILTCAVQSVRNFSSVNHTEHYTTKKENRKKNEPWTKKIRNRKSAAQWQN